MRLLRPSLVLVVGAVLYWLHYFLGFYRYEPSLSSLLYLWACWSTLLVGLLLGESMAWGAKRQKHKDISASGGVVEKTGVDAECFWIVTGVIFIAGCILAFGYLMDFMLSFNLSTPSDVRVALAKRQLGSEAGRDSWLRRIGDLLTWSFVGYGIVAGVTKESRSRFVRLASTAAFIVPMVFALAQGARNPVVFSGLAFLVTVQIRKGKGWEGLSFVSVRWPAVAIVGAFSIVVIVSMFGWRETSVLFQDVSSIKVPGKKPIQMRDLYEAVVPGWHGIGSNVALLSYYVGHSVEFFDALYRFADRIDPVFGLYEFRPATYLLELSGVIREGHEEIVNSQPYVGMYPTAGWGFIMEAGRLGAPIAAGLFGIAGGIIYCWARLGKKLGESLLAVLVPILLVFWIYPVNWGNSDFVTFTVLILWLGWAISNNVVGVFTGESGQIQSRWSGERSGGGITEAR